MLVREAAAAVGLIGGILWWFAILARGQSQGGDAAMYTLLFTFAGGLGLLLPRFRRAAAWGLIALLIAVFPANIQVALQGTMPGLENAPPALLWLRLLFQPVFIAWVWWVGLKREP